ncbi:hypothetical protein C0Z17_03595 [Trinickia caryophylli]|nr:hypothetical protein C0Z17_03595 [Trinickia caryophylli]
MARTPAMKSREALAAERFGPRIGSDGHRASAQSVSSTGTGASMHDAHPQYFSRRRALRVYVLLAFALQVLLLSHHTIFQNAFLILRNRFIRADTTKRRLP